MCRAFFKLSMILIFLVGIGINQSKAQEKKIVRLNEHFFPISENDSVNYFYKAIIVNLTDSTSLERIFNLKNQIVKVTRYGYNQEGNFPEENTETYDSKGRLSSKKIKNRTNGFYQAVYFDEGEQIGEVLFQGENNFEIRAPDNEEIIKADENVFEPKPTLDKDLWIETLKKNLSYPASARRREEGTVILAIYVNEFGERKAPVIANPENVDRLLAEEALRVITYFDGEIAPATTINGNTIDSWLYLPIRFMLD